jgi:GH18 family chitinase
MDIFNTLECEPGIIAVAPYFGYVKPGGGCPQDSCVNVQGPQGDGQRKSPCRTLLKDDFRLNTANGRPVVNGQFQFLLQKLKQVNPSIRISLSIGGWYDSSYWSKATSPKYIDAFVESIGRWTDAFDFDGVDIDWENPGFEHGNQPVYPDTFASGDVESTKNCVQDNSVCSFKDRLGDADRYLNLLQKLRKRFQSSGILKNGLTSYKVPHEITGALPIGFDKLRNIKIKEMCAAFDFINTMTYDLKGAWDPITGHQGQIFDHTPGAPSGPRYAVDDSIQIMLKAGCDPQKLALGIPFYARTFKNVASGPNPNLPGLFQPHGGVAFNAQGVIPYSQVVSDPSFHVYWDDISQASFAYSPSKQIFASFDNPKAIRVKTDYIKKYHLKGGFYWLIGQDDSQDSLLNVLSGDLRP